MILHFTAKHRLVQHFMCLDVPYHEAKRFSNLISMWCKRSGREWTVKRLKGLQQAHKHFALTGIYTVADGWSTRVNRKGKSIYKDRLIHSMMTKTTSERKLKLQFVFFRMHEIIKIPRTSEKQFKTWIEGVTSDFHSAETVRSRIQELSPIIDRIKLPVAKATWDDFLPMVHQPERSKTSPILFNNEVKTRKRTDITTFTLAPLRGERWIKLLQKYPEQVSKCLTGNGNSRLPLKWLTEFGPISNTLCGSIGFIQEKSAKLRAVASPFLVIQAMGEPAKQQLSKLSELVREMHTHTQDAAKQLVSEQLSRGQKVYGFDASAFTDRLPFELQQVVLDKLVREGWLTEFDAESIDIVVNSDWSVTGYERDTFKSNTVRWKVGQPMGYGPSFHLAAVTHWAILVSCATKLGINYRNKFAVVGDDVSIFDEDIAEEYYRVMTDLGVEINLEKSMISSEIGEFCKKIILPGTVLESITIQDNLHNVDSLLNAIGFYGKKFLRYLSRSQKRLAPKALLPIEMGGLGLSPEGMKYTEYLSLLNTASIQRHYLCKEISDFYEVSERRALEFTLNTLSQRYTYWTMPLAYSTNENEAHNVLSFPEDVIICDWTGFPVVHDDEENSSPDEVIPPRSLNSYTEVFDCSLRMELTSQSGKALNAGKILLNSIGYINEHEKACLRPIMTMEIIDDPKVTENPSNSWNKERRKIRSYFRANVASLEW